MSERPLVDPLSDSLARLSEEQRAEAMRRFCLLTPHLVDGVSLVETARFANTPLRTVQRWTVQYRSIGLAGLVRSCRSDTGQRREGCHLLSFRQANWRKATPSWLVCGLPDALYTGHGSDFTSHHIEQVAADLHIELIFSTVGRPDGCGKIERFFSTLNTELLPELPGALTRGKPATPPRLSIAELDAAIHRFKIDTYYTREHSEIGQSLHEAWRSDG